MTDTTTPETGDDSGLKAKNAELLGKLKKADADNKALADRLSALEADAADAADNTKSEVERERAKMQRQIDKLTKDIETRDASLKQLGGELSTLKIDNVISAEIAKAGVLPESVEELTVYLRHGVTMDGSDAVKNGAPLSEALTSYFSSPAAKRHLAAPLNSGAGAQGSTTSAHATGWTKENYTLTAHSKLAKEKGEEVANATARSVGVSWAPAE